MAAQQDGGPHQFVSGHDDGAPATGAGAEPRGPASPAGGIVFAPVNKLSFDPSPQLGLLFAEGFYEWLHYFSKDKARLGAAFAPAFRLGTFFVAVAPGNRVVSMVGCPDGEPALVLHRPDFVATLGQLRGRIAYRVLKRHLIDNARYPFPIEPGMGSIEYVVADPAVRGQGITGRLIEYVMRQRPYSIYMLEVAGTNTRAVRLYERLGFREFLRKPAGKRSGVGDFLYFRNDSPPA